MKYLCHIMKYLCHIRKIGNESSNLSSNHCITRKITSYITSFIFYRKKLTVAKNCFPREKNRIDFVSQCSFSFAFFRLVIEKHFFREKLSRIQLKNFRRKFFALDNFLMKNIILTSAGKCSETIPGRVEKNRRRRTKKTCFPEQVF